MSFTDRLLVWLHIAFVIFAIGPVTIATMSTPRYIRARNIGVLRYLARMTRIFGAASLGVLLFGIIAAQSLHEISRAWLTVSMTLFVVAAVLLLLIMRDQGRAIAAVEQLGAEVTGGERARPVGSGAAPGAGDAAATGAAATGAAAAGAEAAGAGAGPTAAGVEPTAADVEPAPRGPAQLAARTATAAPAEAAHVASVERGRIASLAGVVSLIWLVILVLMVWNS
jgi:hypothetical protein